MVVLSVLSTLGVGGIVATHSVYLSEMTSPLVRNKVLLASQGVTALVAVGVNLLAFWLIPSHWQGFLWISACVEIIILLPLLYLAAAGIAALAGGARPRTKKPNALMEDYEQRCQRISASRWRNRRAPTILWSWPAPAPGRNCSPIRDYRGRTWVLIICWMSGYAGLIYGVGAFFGVYMVDHGGSAHDRVPDGRSRLRGAVHRIPGQCPAWRTRRATRRHRADGVAVRRMLDRGMAGANAAGHRGLLHHQPDRDRAVPVQSL